MPSGRSEVKDRLHEALDFAGLTWRQRDVVLWACEGWTNRQIADLLRVSEQCVRDSFSRGVSRLRTAYRDLERTRRREAGQALFLLSNRPVFDTAPAAPRETVRDWMRPRRVTVDELVGGPNDFLLALVEQLAVGPIAH
jgi:hypothetical protein